MHVSLLIANVPCEVPRVLLLENQRRNVALVLLGPRSGIARDRNQSISSEHSDSLKSMQHSQQYIYWKSDNICICYAQLTARPSDTNDTHMNLFKWLPKIKQASCLSLPILVSLDDFVKAHV
jgi:hypothetical protein